MVFFPLDDSPASEFSVATCRNTTVWSIFISGVGRKNNWDEIIPAYTTYEDGADRVQKSRHRKLRRREITQNKEYNKHIEFQHAELGTASP
jgi:hypothetical protein